MVIKKKIVETRKYNAEYDREVYVHKVVSTFLFCICIKKMIWEYKEEIVKEEKKKAGF